VWFLLLIGVLLLVGLVAVLRQSRGFRGSGTHFADEERPQVKTSKAWPRNDGGGFF
jgi:hypothetical protein